MAKESQRGRPEVHAYAIEQLYVDQHPDFVLDAVPAMLAWLAKAREGSTEYRFEVEVRRGVEEAPATEALLVRWNMQQLSERDPNLKERVRRLTSGRTPHREHVTEVAAYGLALIAISVFLPGRRVVAWSKHVAPDLLFDATPTARRGVEVAGRTHGGRNALRLIRDGRGGAPGKAASLREDAEIAEAWLSLWCASPTVSMMVQVKP
jgi:hypothetical protein